MDFAIVGMDCVLPGADGAEAWIARSRSGSPAFSQVPAGRWPLDPEAAHIGQVGVPDHSASLRGGFVDYPVPAPACALPLDAMDPLFAWVLRVVGGALSGAEVTRDRCGLVLGNLALPSSGSVRAMAPALLHALGLDTPDWLAGGSAWDRWHAELPAALAAQVHGLAGGATSLDAACASGLYAVRLACLQLASGRVDAVVAAGVNRADSAYLHIGFSQLRALSSSGQSRPLSRRADGLLVGEGAAAVLLMRLGDALAAGHTVQAVIRGAGAGNDGKSGNLLAPDVRGQARTLQAAWQGLDLSQLGYVECHATAAPVGDRAEVAGLRELVSSAQGPVVLGSAKALVGHTITAAGIVGLIRAVGAVRDGFFPPLPGCNDPIEGIDGDKLRVVTQATPWPAEQRLAAVSAFGFGGTNGHVVLQSAPTPQPASSVGFEPVPVAPFEPLALVAIGARVGAARGPAVAELLSASQPLKPAPIEVSRGGDLPAGSYLDAVEIDPRRFRIPPVELPHILAQQLCVLDTAADAIAATPLGPRTATVIGMAHDHHLGEAVLRWAIGPDGQRLGPALGAPDVQGGLPNFVANRISAQFDLQGPSYTVAAGACSGLVALAHAERLLASGEVDAAVVGAVDLPGHLGAQRAAQRAGVTGPVAEGAVVCVVRRLADAEAQGLPILAVIRDLVPGPVDSVPPHRSRLGDGQALDGMLALLDGLARAETQLAVPGWLGQGMRATIEPRELVFAAAHDAGGVRVPHSGPPLTPRRWRGSWADSERLPALVLGAPVSSATSMDTGSTRPVGPLPWPPPASHSSSAADDSSSLRSSHRAAPQAYRSPSVASPAQLLGASGLGQLATQMGQAQIALADAHQRFLDDQAHGQRLLDGLGAMLQAATQAVLSGQAVPRPLVAQQPIVPSAPRVPLAAQPAPAPTPAVTHADAPLSSTAVPRQFDRAALERHASGKLSEVFGPSYADLDAYEPRVRMPADPLLLASRVISVEGERGVLGPSRIVTEYDLPQGAWWAHDGKAPPCVVVESGQADLFLVSFLGIDAECKGERVYRLLDCDLSFHGSRPRAGETLRHDIRIKSFARLGATILFYFEYDCVSLSDGRQVLSMRNGSAGFFTPAELARPQGVQWPAASPASVSAQPPIPGAPAQLDATATLALAEGRYADALGSAFSPADGSRLTLPPSQWRLVHRVRELSHHGGAHGLGGLVAEQVLRDDDWFNPCHFEGDPCMPGTLMFDGCMQALEVWLMAAGFPAAYPDATFEPIEGLATKLRCRGQVVPGHSLLAYEVRVKDHGLQPAPWAIADVVLSVDGTPVVLAEDVGVRIEPGALGVVQAPSDTHPPVTVDAARVMEFSVGSPVRAFSQAYAPFDGTGRRCPRMPGPPYLGMSSVRDVQGPHMEIAADRSVRIAYEVPDDAWYFRADPHSSMPYAMLLEIALQPCGWLTAWQGSSIKDGRNVRFRNLGGHAIQRREIHPGCGTLITEATQTQVSEAAGMTLHFYEVRMTLDGEPVFETTTHFGYFDAAALSDQKGIPAIEIQEPRRQAARAQASERQVELLGHPLLPRDDLRMIDRVTVIAPDAGSQGLGYYEASADRHPDDWFFSAHFHLDPVMPGSLGLEALLQLARWVLADRVGPLGPGRLLPLLLDHKVSWKYRGQVPHGPHTLSFELDVIALSAQPRPEIRCDGLVRCDGLAIYTFSDFGLRWEAPLPVALPAPPPPRQPAAALLDSFQRDGDQGSGVLRLDPAAHPWLADHCPTLTVPALPMAFAAEIAAEAASLLRPGLRVVGLPSVEAQQWVALHDGPVELLVVAVAEGDTVAVSLALHHHNARFPKLSGPKVHMRAVVQLAADWPLAPTPPGPCQGSEVAITPADYYASGLTFHGPSLQAMTHCGQRDAHGASASLHTRDDVELLGQPGLSFLLDPLLLDAATHPMWSGAPDVWSDDIAAGQLAYPVRAEGLRFFGPRPAGPVRCQLQRRPAEGLLVFDVWLIGADGPWCSYRWTEALVPAGPVLGAPPPLRKPFAAGEPVDVRIGAPTPRGWRVREDDLVEPLAGTLARLCLCPQERGGDDLIALFAAKEAVRSHLRARLGRDVHPRSLSLLRMRPELFVVREAASLSASEYIAHLGPTRYDLHLHQVDGQAEAWITAREGG